MKGLPLAIDLKKIKKRSNLSKLSWAQNIKKKKKKARRGATGPQPNCRFLSPIKV
jgi:hypothetical protein